MNILKVGTTTGLVLAAGLGLGVAPALARPAAGRPLGRGLSTVPHGGGGLTLAGAMIVVAILAATVAIGVIGWRRDRRAVSRGAIATAAAAQRSARPSGLRPVQDGRPRSASKPLARPAAVGLRARRGRRGGDGSNWPPV
jgi:hypothetical protein